MMIKIQKKLKKIMNKIEQKKKNVLIFPAGTEIANEIFNSLKDNKYLNCVFASSIDYSYANFLNQQVYKMPYVSDESFTRLMNDFIKDQDIDFIIPAHDDVAYELSIIEDKINAKIIGQDAKVNRIVRFKDATYDYFENDLPIAKIFYSKENLEFPVFVKPIRGQGALHSVSLSCQKEFDGFFKKHVLNDFIVMETLIGEEFTIDCFSHKGELLYDGARTREKTTRGISVLSRMVEDNTMNEEFKKYAEIISTKLNIHGIWFYQMKYDKNGKLKLLEVGPRVSGTMMLNRAKGINFVELAIFQAMGHEIEVVVNNISLSLARALVPRYKHDMSYENLYIDFDDTLFLDEKYISSDIMKLIFQAKNENKRVVLITKNKKENLQLTLTKFAIKDIFDEIIHIDENDKKIKYMKQNSLLIDDSFQERKEAINCGHYAYGLDNMRLLFND